MLAFDKNLGTNGNIPYTYRSQSPAQENFPIGSGAVQRGPGDVLFKASFILV